MARLCAAISESPVELRADTAATRTLLNTDRQTPRDRQTKVVITSGGGSIQFLKINAVKLKLE